ncbi:hypothetical protein KFE25_007469 [Diacronema lutheri]|uniref:RRM domain-containing protein n=1 Tax=Diacronema lutheri TaxID=2081491 RepID=A0A8J6CFB8_DIALT|nr:hypothetical protein KFE25_007469 [Diacronema lutheri]
MAVATARLHVQGLTPETTARELASRFEPFGMVSNPIIVRERAHADGSYDDASPSRGFGYVTLCARDPEQVAHCLRTYNGLRWRGRVLRISHANEYYLDRLAREKSEAECAHEGDSAHDEPTWSSPAELRVRGLHAGQVAIVDPANLPNVRTPFADDSEPLQPSRIDWRPIVGCGLRTRGCARWAKGTLETDAKQPGRPGAAMSGAGGHGRGARRRAPPQPLLRAILRLRLGWRPRWQSTGKFRGGPIHRAHGVCHARPA